MWSRSAKISVSLPASLSAGAKGKDGAPKYRQIKYETLFLMERDCEGRYRRLPGTAVHLISFCAPVAFSASLEAARQKLGVGPGTALVVRRRGMNMGHRDRMQYRRFRREG